jgi:hypothetical protein
LSTRADPIGRARSEQIFSLFACRISDLLAEQLAKFTDEKCFWTAPAKGGQGRYHTAELESHNRIEAKGARPQMKHIIAACFFLGLSTTIAGALDMQDLAPCRPAAAKFCDRSGGMTWSNLLRCGATLAAHSFRLGNGCREVLRRYGQL